MKKSTTTKKTAKQSVDGIDAEIAAKKRELRRLERKAKKAKLDLSIAWSMEKRAKQNLCELAKLVKASPDSMGQVIRGALELCRKFYPKAHSANLYVQNATNKERGYGDSCTIQIPLPTADAEKGGVA